MAGWRILGRVLAALFLGAAASFAFTAAAQTKLWMQSDPGDRIGAGASYSYSAPTHTFDSTPLLNPRAVSVSVNGWMATFFAPEGTILAPGAYEEVGRFSIPGPAGMEISGNGRGCNSLTGRYVVLEAAFDGAGNVTSFAVDFEQHCNAAAPALWGELRFNSALPLTIEKPAGSTAPDAFAFNSVVSAPMSVWATSHARTIYGINAPAVISVANGEYSINGGEFTSAPGTVGNRDAVRVRVLTAATPNTGATAILTVGGVAAGFTATTYTPGEPQTGLVVESFPGDFIGLGGSYFFHPPEWTFYAYGAVIVNGTAPGDRRFGLRLNAPLGGVLAVGAYEDAARQAFSGTSPGLDFSMDSRGCNMLFGRFAILEIDLAATPMKLAVDFEQWCDELPPSFGELRINSTIPYNFQVTSPDSQPEPMAFNPIAAIRPGAMAYSNYTRIYGTNAPVPISITGGEYSINGGPFTSSPGVAGELDALQVRVKSSPVPGAARLTVLNAGGTLATFSVRTYATDMPVNGVYYRSSSIVEFIGKGHTRFFPGPPTLVTAARTFDSGIDLRVTGPDDLLSYFAEFAAPGGAALQPGVYEAATRWGFQAPGEPGLSFAGEGRGCNMLQGRFIVREALYNADGSVQRFAADFEQRCVTFGIVEAPLYGQVRYNSLVPFSVYLSQNRSQDTNGDATDDLLWQHTDGRAAIWLMDGLTPTSGAEIIGPGTGWNATHLADFNGDGKADVLWQHPDGRAAIWLMNGTAPSEMRQILNAGDGWSITHTPDLDGDGKADLLFQNVDGSIAAWTMDGTTMTSGATLPKPPPGSGWRVSKTADFDGDGKDDLLWVHAHGNVELWLMNGVAQKASPVQFMTFGTGWMPAHAGDLDGDGKADIVWQHSDGRIAAWLMNGTTMASGATLLGPGTGWQVRRLADFDGDGRADLYFEHPDGRAAIWLMQGLVATAQTQILNAGGGWSAKRLADLDGDGKADIVWQNTDGRVAVWLMSGTAVASGAGILGAATGWSLSNASP